MSTLRQKRVVARILENGGNVSKAMREVGYSPQTAKVPSKLTESKGFREEIEPIIAKMMAERDAIMDALPDKRSKAKYRDLMDGADKMTKNIQLLTGGKTANENISFEWER